MAALDLLELSSAGIEPTYCSIIASVEMNDLKYSANLQLIVSCFALHCCRGFWWLPCVPTLSPPQRPQSVASWNLSTQFSSHCDGIYEADGQSFNASHAGIGIIVGAWSRLLWCRFQMLPKLPTEGMGYWPVQFCQLLSLSTFFVLFSDCRVLLWIRSEVSLCCVVESNKMIYGFKPCIHILLQDFCLLRVWVGFAVIYPSDQ